MPGTDARVAALRVEALRVVASQKGWYSSVGPGDRAEREASTVAAMAAGAAVVGVDVRGAQARSITQETSTSQRKTGVGLQHAPARRDPPSQPRIWPKILTGGAMMGTLEQSAWPAVAVLIVVLSAMLLRYDPHRSAPRHNFFSRCVWSL